MPNSVGRQGERGENLGQLAALVVGVENEFAPLFDQGAGERVAKRALGQGELLRLALAGLAGRVGCAQRQLAFGARPRAFRQVDGRARLADAARPVRQRQREFRRLDEMMLFRAARGIERALSAGHADGVGDAVMQGERAA